MTKVTVYSTPTCPWCHKVKDFLTKHKVKFEDKDVATDEKAREVMLEKSGQMGVPQIDVDGEIVVGFDEQKLKKILKI